MIEYTWDFSLLWNYVDLWIRGTTLTIVLSGLIILTGTLLGIVLVIGMKSRFSLLNYLSRVLVDIIRAIPALVLLGTMFFVLPIMTGVAFDPISIAFIALSINLAPFASECIRAGVDSIPTVQYESAKLMGFRGWKLIRHIIGPQVFRRILPPLTGQWITSLKLTSLAATIGVAEIWNVTGQVVTDTALPLETRMVGALLYMAIILPCLIFVTWLEKKFKVKGFGMVVNQ